MDSVLLCFKCYFLVLDENHCFTPFHCRNCLSLENSDVKHLRSFQLLGFEFISVFLIYSCEYSVSKMEITNVTEYEAIAKEKLPKMVYDYYASGAEDQWTLKENRNAFSRILYVPFHTHQFFSISVLEART